MKKIALFAFASLLLFAGCKDNTTSDPSEKATGDSDSSAHSGSDKPKTVKPKRFVAFADEKDGKYGFTDASGNVLIDYRFDCAASFRGSFARVGKGECSFGRLKSGKYGFIDTQGNLVVDYVWDGARDFHEGYAAVATGEYGEYGILNNAQWGYIDTTGKEVISLQFDDAEDFSEGYAVVRKGKAYTGKYGYVKKDGQMALDFQYDLADDFMGGYAAVGYKRKIGLIDKWGQMVIPFEYDNYKTIVVILGDSGNGYFTQDGYAILEKKGKWDYVDKQNKPLTGFQYEDLGLFSEGLAAVKKGGLWGYINESGEEVIKPRFYYAGQFSGGTATVETSEDEDAPKSEINYKGVVVTHDH